MPFRDDREGLRARLADVEGALERAEQELLRRRDDDTEVDRLERQLDEARATIALMGEDLAQRARPAKFYAPSAAVLATVVAVAAATSVALLLAVARTDHLRTPAFVPVANAKTPPGAAMAASAVQVRCAGGRTVTAKWDATVTRATGISLVPGARCTVSATLSQPRAVSDVVVECGGQELYRAPAGTGAPGAGDFEQVTRTLEDGHGRVAKYRLRYVDMTAAPERVQASIYSEPESVLLTRRGAISHSAPMRVELHIAQFSGETLPLIE